MSQANHTVFSYPATSDMTILLGREPTLEERLAHQAFPCLVPTDFLAGDDQGPLLRQVVPDARELLEVAGFRKDPLAEGTARPVPGIIRRFQGRALLLASSACAIHCRYCFRRHDPLADAPRTLEDWQTILQHLAGDSSIQEVILSGGDPLTLEDDPLAWLIQQLAAIPHIQTLRIHSRMAVVVPSRLGEGFIQALTASRLTPILMIHCNHPAELTPQAVEGLQELAKAGILLFNQSVLLAGVNDSLDTLCALSQALIAARVAPCYLHLLDPVAGAAHFQVSALRGSRLIQGMRRRLPGYAVPRLVREMVGLSQKKIISA
ncbi:MAG: KamA family radical SAM protein [Magnetococcales bacterium]|nr:KamA family radical SAM protein [Magnetococcales bacterium]NGZ25932.1 KamA family radical SAM protein [Magnetococcales bacterium]